MSPSEGPLRGVILGLGGEMGYYSKGDCPPVDGFRSTSCSLDKTAFDVALSAEYQLWKNLAIGVSFDRKGAATLARDIESLTTPGLTAQLREGRFDPTIWSLYAQPTLPLAGGFWLFGELGIAYWDAKSGNTTTVHFGGREVDRRVTAQDDSGFTPIFGLGVTFWRNDRVGVSAGYQYVNLQDDATNVDAPIHGFKGEVNFRFGGRR
jgi:opacity protein-like surface antigen